MRVMTFLVGVLKSASSIKMRIAGQIQESLLDSQKASMISLLNYPTHFELIWNNNPRN
jgi:hypothetical protein